MESRISRLALLLLLVMLLAPYCWVAITRYRAETLANKLDRDSLAQAVSLEPGDAEYHQRLARYSLYAELNADQALREYRASIDLDPYDAASWLGLAQSHLVLGNDASAEQAVRRALEVDPRTPEVAWEAGNVLVAIGRVESALPLFQFVLANDPAMLIPALHLIHRVEPSGARAAALALPPDPAIHFVFINQLVQSGDLESAKQVWNALAQLHRPVVPNQGFYFFNALLANRDYEGAELFWRDIASICPDVARREQPGNLLHNGSFEFPVLDGGLDWQYAVNPDVDLQTDTSDAHEGNKSLLAVFHGDRTAQAGITQTVLLKPNTQYRFRGFMKSSLEGANGLRFTLVDTQTQKHLFDTEETAEERQWKEYTAVFRTGPNTRVGVFLIGRSQTTLIRGSLLIDDLHLEEVAP